MIKKASHVKVIVLHEQNPVLELGHRGNLHDLLDQLFAPLIRWVGFARKEKLHWALRIVDDLRQLIQIAEKQSGPLVGRKTPRKTNRQGLRVEQLIRRTNLPRGRPNS